LFAVISRKENLMERTWKTGWLASIAVLVALGTPCHALGQSSGQSPVTSKSEEPNPSQIVLVTVTPRGTYLSHSNVKPGKVRFVIINQTLLPTAELQLSTSADTKTNGAGIAVNRPEHPFLGSNPLFDAALAEGTVGLGIKGLGGFQAQLKVKP
jgi:hypothetical protein